MSKGQSKLSVDATVTRKNLSFSAHIRQKYIELSLWWLGTNQHFVCRPTITNYLAFWNDFDHLTYQIGYRTRVAVLKDFRLYGVKTSLRFEMQVRFNGNGMYNLSVFRSDDNEPALFNIQLREQEAREIFEELYHYFLT